MPDGRSPSEDVYLLAREYYVEIPIIVRLIETPRTLVASGSRREMSGYVWHSTADVENILLVALLRARIHTFCIPRSPVRGNNFAEKRSRYRGLYRDRVPARFSTRISCSAIWRDMIGSLRLSFVIYFSFPGLFVDAKCLGDEKRESNFEK